MEFLESFGEWINDIQLDRFLEDLQAREEQAGRIFDPYEFKEELDKSEAFIVLPMDFDIEETFNVSKYTTDDIDNISTDVESTLVWYDGDVSFMCHVSCSDVRIETKLINVKKMAEILGE